MSGPMFMPSPVDRTGRAYKPGQMVPISGVYSVIHALHRPDHEVLAIRGDEFPACRTCKSQVRFLPAYVVTYLAHDFDLAGPRLTVRKGRSKAAGS